MRLQRQRLSSVYQSYRIGFWFQRVEVPPSRFFSTRSTIRPMDLYKERVASGALIENSHQLETVSILNDLQDKLLTYKPPRIQDQDKPSWFSKVYLIIHGINDGVQAFSSRTKEDRIPDNIPKGIYIGKTMLMDVFYEAMPTEQKRRVHFHSFMLDVHSRIHQLKSDAKNPKLDAIPMLSRDLAKKAWLLCFDEFQVTDIADAMILRRLFTELYRNGVVMVITSNRHPTDLYKNGIQRASFIPCIQLIQSQNLVHSLNSGVDYRKLEREAGNAYFTPISNDTHHQIDLIFHQVSRGRKPKPRTLHVLGRPISVRQQCEEGRVARFTFDELCARPLSAADYLELVKHYDTFIVEHIPQMTTQHRNEMRRFITLIDTLYENKIRLICSSEADIRQLYKSESNSYVAEEAFAFDRCVSRLIQMQSKEWMQHKRVDLIKFLMSIAPFAVGGALLAPLAGGLLTSAVPSAMAMFSSINVGVPAFGASECNGRNDWSSVWMGRLNTSMQIKICVTTNQSYKWCLFFIPASVSLVEFRNADTATLGDSLRSFVLFAERMKDCLDGGDRIRRSAQNTSANITHANGTEYISHDMWRTKRVPVMTREDGDTSRSK